MKRILLIIPLIFLLATGLVIGQETQKAGLILINNYSGVDTVGGNQLSRLVNERFTKAIRNSGSNQFLDYQQTEELLKQNEFQSYYEASNLCVREDLFKIGQKIGLTQLLVLEINGYNEIKKEKSNKSYQLLLSLKVYNCQDNNEFEYIGEGFGDGNREQAFSNAITQLVNNYYKKEISDPNIGNVRATNVPVIGNKTSLIYHMPDCLHPPASENCDRFNTRIEAETANFRPCPICFPSYKSYVYGDRNIEEGLGSEACGLLEYYYRLDHNPELIQRLEKIAEPIIADTIRKNVDYKFRILDSTEVNAFAASNGFIYVTKGLLDIIESDDELAFVLAHEIAHIEKKHAVINYKRAMALSFMAAIFIAGSGNDSKDNMETALFTSVMLNIIMKGYSREQEREADEVGFAHLKRTGKNYQEHRTLFGKFSDMRQKKIYAINKLFSTHPTPEQRKENLANYLKAYELLHSKL